MIRSVIIVKSEGELFCPVKATMRLLGQKWTLQIIHALSGKKMRFNELAQTVGGINSRTLSQRLRELEFEGIVARRTISSIPPWVEYELTEKGKSLADVVESIAEWGKAWMETPSRQSPREADHI